MRTAKSLLVAVLLISILGSSTAVGAKPNASPLFPPSGDVRVSNVTGFADTNLDKGELTATVQCLSGSKKTLDISFVKFDVSGKGTGQDWFMSFTLPFTPTLANATSGNLGLYSVDDDPGTLDQWVENDPSFHWNGSAAQRGAITTANPLATVPFNASTTSITFNASTINTYIDQQISGDGIASFGLAIVHQCGEEETSFRSITLCDKEPYDPDVQGSSSQCVAGDEPNYVELISFSASPLGKGILLAWTTASEVDNEGFNIYRSEAEDGEYVKINDALIPAQGDPSTGASYSFVDTDVRPGKTYYYKLEDVDTSGNSTFHGPVSATVRGKGR